MPIPANYRWLLQEKDGVTVVDEYRFHYNPNRMGSLEFRHERQRMPTGPSYDGSPGGNYSNDTRPRTLQSKPQPLQWSFSGVIRSEAHHAALVEWTSKTVPVELTDHYGRVYEVLFSGLQTDEQRPTATNAWRFRYTANALVLRRVS